MAKLRCKPLPSGHTAPAYASTNIPGPVDWELTDDSSADGNIIKVDILSLPAAATGFKINYFEVAVSDDAGATTIHHAVGGPAVGYTRRFRAGTARNRQRVQIRSVQERLNQIVWNDKEASPYYTPVAGDSVVQASTGATATVKFGGHTGTSNARHVVLEDISGTFEDGGEVTINGRRGVQGSPLHTTHYPDQQDVLKSEWSLPKDITPVAGTPTVTITASKTSVLQGQSVVLEADAAGFQCTRPVHELTYRFHVDQAGEQGGHVFLPESFESCFGTGSNNRCESYSSVWSFCPRTKGTVTVYCEVNDTFGNVATGSIDLTVSDVVSSFVTENVYAVSASSTAVPGNGSVTPYASLASAIAAIPTFTDDDCLLLLDVNETHDMGDWSAINLKDISRNGKAAIMPYNASGVGPDAGARAVVNHALNCQAGELTVFGVDFVGPFDPTDPFSITEKPTDGLAIDKVGFSRADKSLAHVSISECSVAGYNSNIILPDAVVVPGLVGVFVDVYTTDWFNFGVFGDNVGKHAMAGCYIKCNPKAWREGGKLDSHDNAVKGFFADHGPYRASRPEEARGWSKCCFFSTTGWGASNSVPQPPLRFFGSGKTDKPLLSHATQLMTEGANFSINATSRGGGNTTCHPQDFVLDKFYHIPTLQPATAMNIGFGGVTVRNGVIATGDNERVTPLKTGTRQHIGTSDQNTSNMPGQNDNVNNPITIEFITIADLRVDSGQNAQELVAWKNNADYPMANVSFRSDTILTYAPNFTKSDTAAEPLSTEAQWAPLYAGHYWWNAEVNAPDAPTVEAQTIDTSYATKPITTASYEPAPGSSAYQTAQGPVSYHDIRSRVRPVGKASKGAYDPGAI